MLTTLQPIPRCSSSRGDPAPSAPGAGCRHWDRAGGQRLRSSRPSDDLVFTFQTSRDAEIATLPSAAARLVKSVDAPDPLTFVMHWSGPHVDAPRTGVGDIAPRHLLEDMYLKDKKSMANSTLFST